MSSSQPSLIASAITAERLLPENENQWQVNRDRSLFPNGTYSAIDKNGNIEYIGGGVAGGSFSVDITSPDGLALTAAVTGGLAPYTYAWTVRSKFINGTDIGFNPAPGNSANASIDNRGASFDGDVQVKVTDANGRITYNQWRTRKDVIIP